MALYHQILSAKGSMSPPETGSDTPPRKSSWKPFASSKWLGPCASFLCFLHCFSLPAVMLAAPGIIHVVPYKFLHDIELIFWIIALDLGLFSMRKAEVALKWQRLYFSISLAAPFTIFFGHTRATQAVLGLMALVQFWFIYTAHRNSLKSPECCHDH